MNKTSLFMAAMLASVLAGTAGAIPAPPFLAEAMDYMDEQRIGEACLELRVRAGQPSEIVVSRSSGDARFDALVAKGLRLEIDVLARFPLDWRPADASGWRTIPLKLSQRERRDDTVLGCAATGPAR